MHGDAEQSARDAGGHTAAWEGVLIALKVAGLLAGYVIFVWLAMTQLERRYPAPMAEARTLNRPSPKPTEVPGVVVIRAVPLLRTNTNPASAGAPR